METITAKEIAEDVQQTFDNVSNQYKNILEIRITQLVEHETKLLQIEIQELRNQNERLSDSIQYLQTMDKPKK